jgi:hypothetical protein
LRNHPDADAGSAKARSPSGAPLAALAKASERFGSAQAALHAIERMQVLSAPSIALKPGTWRSGLNAGGDDARTARKRDDKSRPQEPHSLHDQVCLEITPSMSELA